MYEEGKWKILERLDLGELVTFVPNKDRPIHNWFHFKEGFSRDLVAYLLRIHGASRDIRVLDPFMGVGTTPLTCKELGYRSIGIEVNPLFHFIARAKTNKYDPDEIDEWIKWVSRLRYRPVDLGGVSHLVRKAFNPHNLRDIIFFRDRIMELDDDRSRDFLLMGLINASSKVTYAVKDGAVIRFRKKPTPPFREFYIRTLRKMKKDVMTTRLHDTETILILGDARKMDMIDDESIDLVITSPPYLNKIEYTKVYEIETELFLGRHRIIPLRSYIGLVYRGREIELPIDADNLPKSAVAYLKDLWTVIRELYRVMRPGATAYLVVAEGLYRDRKVPVDTLLAEIADQEGFGDIEIWVVNKRVVTIERTVKLGVARESIVKLVKE